MTRDELVRTLAAIAHALDSRWVVTRIVIDANRNELKRICRVSQVPRDSRTREPHSEGERE